MDANLKKTGVLIKRGTLDIDTYRERPCEHEGRDQRDASKTHGMPVSSSKLSSETKRQAWSRFFLMVLKRT